jgi:hypothetical protein
MTHTLSPRRPAPPGRLPHWAGCVLLAAAVVTLAGCKDDEIKHYQVPHEQAVVAPHGKIPPGGPAMGDQDRIVAAFLPEGEGNSLFFKMSGDPAVLERLKPDFQQFLEKSVDLKKTPDKWEPLPKGWEYDSTPNEMRKATFLVTGTSVQVAVSNAAGTELENVNRWRGMVGLPPTIAADLPKQITPQKIGGQDGKLVDFARPPREKVAGEPTWTVPAGWEKAPLAQFSMATFKISAKDPGAKVTVTPIGQYGLQSNVVRWRGQVGLPETTKEQILQEVAKVDVNGHSADRVDYTGTSPQTGTKQRLVVVAVHQGTSAWVIKIVGTPEAVGEQMAAFEAFVKSFQIPAGEGEK